MFFATISITTPCSTIRRDHIAGEISFEAIPALHNLCHIARLPGCITIRLWNNLSTE
jgi:hypothetical protein